MGGAALLVVLTTKPVGAVNESSFQQNCQRLVTAVNVSSGIASARLVLNERQTELVFLAEESSARYLVATWEESLGELHFTWKSMRSAGPDYTLVVKPALDRPHVYQLEILFPRDFEGNFLNLHLLTKPLEILFQRFDHSVSFEIELTEYQMVEALNENFNDELDEIQFSGSRPHRFESQNEKAYSVGEVRDYDFQISRDSFFPEVGPAEYFRLVQQFDEERQLKMRWFEIIRQSGIGQAIADSGFWEVTTTPVVFHLLPKTINEEAVEGVIYQYRLSLRAPNLEI